MKLTKIQVEVLRLLEGGSIMIVDATNSTKIGEREVQFQTRTFLTKHRLITRLDKLRAAGVRGNGFTLSERGKAALAKVVLTINLSD